MGNVPFTDCGTLSTVRGSFSADRNEKSPTSTEVSLTRRGPSGPFETPSYTSSPETVVRLLRRTNPRGPQRRPVGPLRVDPDTESEGLTSRKGPGCVFRFLSRFPCVPDSSRRRSVSRKVLRRCFTREDPEPRRWPRRRPRLKTAFTRETARRPHCRDGSRDRGKTRSDLGFVS